MFTKGIEVEQTQAKPEEPPAFDANDQEEGPQQEEVDQE
jgi:hypothetical protein